MMNFIAAIVYIFTVIAMSAVTAFVMTIHAVVIAASMFLKFAFSKVVDMFINEQEGQY